MPKLSAVQHNIAPSTVRDKIFSDSDIVTLEDESGRIKLIGEALQKFHIVTGVIMAALGCENIQGEFEVADLCFTDPAPRVSLQAADAMDVDDSDDAHEIALVSGLDFGGKHTNDMSMQLLLDFFDSELGDEQDQRRGAALSRLVIVGNSFAEPEQDEDMQASAPLASPQSRQTKPHADRGFRVPVAACRRPRLVSLERVPTNAGAPHARAHRPDRRYPPAATDSECYLRRRAPL